MQLKRVWVLCSILLVATLAACAAEVTPSPQPAPTATVAPTTAATPSASPVTCADMDAHWGQDWAAVLGVLDRLIEAGQSCGEEPLLSKKYAVHFNYGASLENEGQLEAAVEQYQAALTIDSGRREALGALIRLKALPPPTPPACMSAAPPLPDPAPAGPPDTTQFIKVQNNQLTLHGQPFTVKGVNYYPRQAPWQRFLTEANPAEMAKELDLIQKAGFNTLRIFLWNEPLFTCQPEDAIPNESTFATLDTLLKLARERNLKVIITLNDLPDLVFRPLYTDWVHYDNQTAYIVRRYRNEPAILAWDVRNEGDVDYGAQSAADAKFSQTEVIDWVGHISQLVYQNDPHHLVTAGWWGDPIQVEPYVDFLSFHLWTDVKTLQTRIKQYRQHSAKPLILQEVGYHSWADSPGDPITEKEQANRLSSLIKQAEADKLAGWVIWTAFDFVPAPGQSLNEEHFFGLWRNDLTPKSVIEKLPLNP
jgi:hypothetical protein